MCAGGGATERGYAELQRELQASAKDLIKGTGEIMNAAKNDPENLGNCAKQMNQACQIVTAAASQIAAQVGGGGVTGRPETQ